MFARIAICCGCVIVTILLCTTIAQAGDVDLSQNTSTVVTNDEGGQIPASPNDADLGEQQILDRKVDSFRRGITTQTTESPVTDRPYQPFTAAASTLLFYTSNAALTPNHERSDAIEATAAGIYYEPRITKALFGLVDVREQLFFYNHFNKFDFGTLDVEAGLSYFVPELHGLILRGSYDFSRFTFSDRVLDEFFSNHSIVLLAEVPFRLSRAQQLSVGLDTNISVAADHESPRRNSYETYLGYSVLLTKQFSMDGVGRVVVRDYYHGGRTDVSEILSLCAHYRLTNCWTVSAVSTFALNDSNHDVHDYAVSNLGGAMSFQLKF
jgi:hypothetical protein